MKCDDIKEYLGLYPSEEINAETAAQIEAHLKECKACASELTRIKKTISQLPQMPSLSETYWKAYTQKVIGRIEAERNKLTFFNFRWAPVLAGFFIVLGGFTYYGIQQSRQTREIIQNLEMLEHLELFNRDDFERLLK